MTKYRYSTNVQKNLSTINWWQVHWNTTARGNTDTASHCRYSVL